MHKYVYRFDRQGGDKSKRPGWLKRPPFYLGMFCGLQFCRFSDAPPVINPILDPMIALVIGALAFCSTLFLQEKYNIQGSFTSRQ